MSISAALRPLARSFCLAVVCAAALPVVARAATPTITSFSPASGPVGTTVVINGTNFDAPLSITFAGNAAAGGSFTATQITVTVPSGAETGPITVATAGGSVATSSAFTVGTAAHPAFFTGEAALANGVYYLAFPNGNYFGFYTYLSEAGYIYHYDLGFEYVIDAEDAQSGVFFYDFKSDDYFYTSPTFPFPYLYDFGLKSFVYYYPDPNEAGHYNTDGVRYFYVFSTGKIISK